MYAMISTFLVTLNLHPSRSGCCFLHCPYCRERITAVGNLWPLFLITEKNHSKNTLLLGGRHLNDIL